MSSKNRIGIVVSNKAEKSIVVSIQTRYSHKKYGKILLKTKRYMAHDEKKSCQLGDIVVIEEVAPISKQKKWIVKNIVKTSKK